MVAVPSSKLNVCVYSYPSAEQFFFFLIRSLPPRTFVPIVLSTKQVRTFSHTHVLTSTVLTCIAGGVLQLLVPGVACVPIVVGQGAQLSLCPRGVENGEA